MSSPACQSFRLGLATVHLDRREVVHPDRTLTLTALEVRLLAHLAAQAGSVVSRDELLREVWGYAEGVRTRAPHHAITRIRKKVEAEPAEPVHLISVYGEGYRLDAIDGHSAPPPAPDLTTTTPQLRDRPTRFIGRRSELDQLAGWLQGGPRVLTVIGPAGAGKTRLCSRFAEDNAAAFPGGSWLVELDGLDGPELVAEAVAAALQIQGSGGDRMTQLAAVLHARGPALLVLDDLQFNGNFLASWLETAPALRVMVTARQRQVLPEQQAVFLRAMPEADATALLQARAQIRTPQSVPFAASDALTTLIEGLDGLPLAIELAAARMRILGVEGVLAGLDDRFRLLRARSDRGIDPRKADLRAVLEVSWHQLEPQAQLGLAHLSVFRGVFSLEAAEAVIDLSDWPGQAGAWDVLETLEDHSLLEVVGAARQRPRFRLLHSVRDLARDFLAEPGAVPGPSDTLTGPAAVEAARARHAAHFAALGSPQNLRQLQTAEGPAVLRQLHRAYEEMLSALAWAVPAKQTSLAVKLSEAILEVASSRGPIPTLNQWLPRLLSIPGLPGRDAARLATRWGRVRSKQGAWDAAREDLEARLATAQAEGAADDIAGIRAALGQVEIGAGNTALAREHLTKVLGFEHLTGDLQVGGLAQVGLAQIDQLEGHIERAATAYEAALKRFQQAGHQRMVAVLYGYIGSLDQERGRLTRARQRYGQALDIARQTGARDLEIAAGGNLAGVLVELGHQSEAEALLVDTIARCRELGLPHLEGRSLGNLATLYQTRGKLESAEEAFLRSIDLLQSVHEPTTATIMRGNLAEVFMLQGRNADAAELIEEVLAAIEAGHACWSRGYFLGVAAQMRARVGNTQGAWQALREGEALLRSAGRRVDLGKLLCRRCELLLQQGDEDQARAALEEADALAREMGAADDSELRGDIRRQQRQLSMSAADRRQ